jgi:hypothetical protein
MMGKILIKGGRKNMITAFSGETSTAETGYAKG